MFNEIYIQDITKRNRVKNIGELEDLLNILSSAIVSLTNPEKLKNTFKTVKKSKITSNTIKKYLDYFEDSFLIESAQRFDIKGKAYIETPKKYYFSDLGLRNARINFRQFEQTHSMENVIYNELRMRGYSVDVGVVPITKKDKDGKVVCKQLEVDFVCNLGSLRYYIQSAYSLPDEEMGRNSLGNIKDYNYSIDKVVNNGKLEELENNLRNHNYFGACAECTDWIYHQQYLKEKYVTVYLLVREDKG